MAVLVWAVLILQVVEAIPEDELARLAIMLMSSRCLSNRNMNSSKFVELHVSNLSIVVKEDMVWVVADRPLGKVCMMMSRNQLFQAVVEVVVEVVVGDIREAGEGAVRGDLRRHKVDLKVLRLPMLQLDRRMLASPVRTIVEVVEVAIEASTLMLEVESQRNAAMGVPCFGLRFSNTRRGRGRSQGNFLLSVTVQNIA